MAVVRAVAMSMLADGLAHGVEPARKWNMEVFSIARIGGDAAGNTRLLVTFFGAASLYPLDTEFNGLWMKS